MPSRVHCFLLAVLVSGVGIGALAVEPEGFAGGRSYRIVDGKVDRRTYNGFRFFHAGCNHCHGQDGLGSTVAPSLIDRLPPIDRFRSIVLGGINNEGAVMKGFGGDPTLRLTSMKSTPTFRRGRTAFLGVAAPIGLKKT